MSSKYKKLDAAIIKAVTDRGYYTPIDHPDVVAAAKKVALAQGRYFDRVIDARMKALKATGQIRYLKKADAPNGKCGWYLGDHTQPVPK